MIKVITYGTYDYLHYGHIRLLERAKALGDYLIVGITADDFDKTRGKINVQQTLMERVEAVRATGLADEIIIEEYEGQKIDDIRKYNIDIFTVGSDWVGKFDYLNEYCKVIYLDRTKGISSSDIRTEKRKIRIGLVGSFTTLLDKFIKEIKYVNGLSISGIYINKNIEPIEKNNLLKHFITYDELLDNSDAIYIFSSPETHYQYAKKALLLKKHVLCESPISINKKQTIELFDIAKRSKCILQEGMKTLYSTAYQRMLLLLKTGVIGDIVSVDATCTSLSTNLYDGWKGFTYWGPTALLPVFQVFGPDYKHRNITLINGSNHSEFLKVDFIYDNGFATIKAGNGVKSEGDLIVSGTLGYIYVPSPWWKTDYFEIRFEDINKNKRYFYQLEGEGIRNEISAFANSINSNKKNIFIDDKISVAITSVMEDYNKSDSVFKINI